MNADFIYQKECLTADLIEYLMEDYKINMHEAMNVLYESDTYLKICEPSTGLYFQSSKYVYSYLTSELDNGQLHA